jgi:3-methyladenine DNA glycosylase Mpg
MTAKRIENRKFFTKPAETVAKELLGKILFFK